MSFDNKLVKIVSGFQEDIGGVASDCQTDLAKVETKVNEITNKALTKYSRSDGENALTIAEDDTPYNNISITSNVFSDYDTCVSFIVQKYRMFGLGYDKRDGGLKLWSPNSDDTAGEWKDIAVRNADGKLPVLLDYIYPPGSIYWTTDPDCSPADLYGGIWSQPTTQPISDMYCWVRGLLIDAPTVN